MNTPLTDRHARTEAERCLQCYDPPCSVSCPAHIDIPGFIAMVRTGNLTGAAEVVKSANALANVCGRVCPEEVFCQPVCTRGKQDTPIAIRELHSHATQHEAKRGYSTPRPFPGNGHSVAMIGGGPAGLSCAFELAKLGYRIDLYERKLPGGVPRSSIPSFRLSDAEVRADLDFLSRYVAFRHEDVDAQRFARIRKSHDALFVAVGLTVDRLLPIPGTELPGVIPVLSFLESAKAGLQVPPLGNRVLIVGGGNVSLDAAATAKRMGCREVVLIYRRGEKEMRVWVNELGEARSQGVQMQFLTSPVEIIGRSRVEALRCRRTRLSDRLDATGRPLPVEIKGSEFTLEADLVIPAIGQVPSGDFLDLFARTPEGYLKVDESFSTSLPGVFAGGDVVGGEGTIVQSVGQGKMAALGIHRYLLEGAGA
jgi:NADPH-dependent glutamate synthase beta subunit-like oxidoreductase